MKTKIKLNKEERMAEKLFNRAYKELLKKNKKGGMTETEAKEKAVEDIYAEFPFTIS